MKVQERSGEVKGRSRESSGKVLGKSRQGQGKAQARFGESPEEV